MIKKLISLAMGGALVCCFCGISVYANGTGTDPRVPPVKTVTPAEKSRAQEKLKVDMAKLVSDAKAAN